MCGGWYPQHEAAAGRLPEKNGCHIALDTDAHSTTQLQGNMPPLLAMLEEMQFPQELVVNATRQNLVMS